MNGIGMTQLNKKPNVSVFSFLGLFSMKFFSLCLECGMGILVLSGGTIPMRFLIFRFANWGDLLASYVYIREILHIFCPFKGVI